LVRERESRKTLHFVFTAPLREVRKRNFSFPLLFSTNLEIKNAKNALSYKIKKHNFWKVKKGFNKTKNVGHC
jgi:hypothetical protein